LRAREATAADRVAFFMGMLDEHRRCT
jgi:hypothetical protein